MATLLKMVKAIAAFPTADVETCIRNVLQEQADTQAILRPPPSSGAPAGPGWEPEIDSLAVIEIICSIEELLGITLPPSFAPRGGYEDADGCVQDLLSAAKAVWPKVTQMEDEHA